MKYLKTYFLSLTTLDLRSLALMRIGYGLVALFDLLNRAQDFRMHYTNEGALSNDFVFQHALNPGDWSLYLLHDSTSFAMLLYGIHLLAVFCLLLGWRTRAATIICWILFASLHDRNFAILNSGDNWLKLILFWAIFLPWGHRWSLDATRGGQVTSDSPQSVASVACFAYLFQEFSVYFFSGIFKTGDSWHVDGTAVYHAMQLNEWSGYLSPLVLYYPGLMKLMSFTVVWLEVCLPFLLFTPWFRGPVMTFLAIVFMGFHLSLLPVMSLGIFPIVGIVSAIGIFPADFWALKPMKWLQGVMDSIWVRPEPEDSEQYPVDPPIPCRRPISELMIAVFIALGFYWSANSLSASTQTSKVKMVSTVLNLDQNWSLFAPNPPTESGWMLLVGELENGETVDLVDGTRPASKVKPRRPFAKYHGQRDRRFFVTIGSGGYPQMAGGYGEAAARMWDRDNPGQELRSLKLVWLSQMTLPNYEARPISEKVVWEMTRETTELDS